MSDFKPSDDFTLNERRLRVWRAARRGIRIVPSNPDASFRAVTFACDLRPARCGSCTAPCPYETTR